MILLFFQIAVLATLIVFLVRWANHHRRRNLESWESLLARLRSDWSARELSDHFLWKEELDVNPDLLWQRLEGPKGLCVIFQNARVMLELADFADRHVEGVDHVALETLRSDAMQIRLCVLMALAQYAFMHASEGVRVNSFRAAEMYTGMAARLTRFLQNHAAVIVPDYVAAM